MNPLDQLEYISLPVRLGGTDEWYEVLLDGDYDGEWLSGLPWSINPVSGYVTLGNGNLLRTGSEKYSYLHHYVVHPKRGYRVVHLNGNLLDNRSRNLELVTMREAALLRQEHRRQREFTAWARKMQVLRRENGPTTTN